MAKISQPVGTGWLARYPCGVLLPLTTVGTSLFYRYVIMYMYNTAHLSSRARLSGAKKSCGVSRGPVWGICKAELILNSPPKFAMNFVRGHDRHIV